LIQSSAFHFNDRLVWFGPGGQNLEDLAFHPQSISWPGWFGPCQLAAEPDDPIAQRQSSGHHKPHGDCSGMPPARGQPAEHGGLSGCLIEMKRLRIEFRCECLDPLLIHPIGVGREPLADVQIFQIEALFMIHRSFIRSRAVSPIDDAVSGLELRSRDSALALRKQNNFAEGARFQDFFMGAASLCKRQFLPNNRPQGAIFQAGKEPGVSLLFFGFSYAPESKGVN
jgi:hypothetical protein